MILVPQDALKNLLDQAKALGADGADIMAIVGEGIDVNVQGQKLESLERHTSTDVGLRVIVGHKQAIGSTSDVSLPSLERLVTQTVAMAKHLPDDPFTGLARPDQIISQYQDLDLLDTTVAGEEELLAMAMEVESAAMAIPGITATEGAGAGWSTAQGMLLSSNGFMGEFASSTWSCSVAPVAGSAPNMQVDYDASITGYRSDLRSPQDIGQRAAERALQRRNPQTITTGTYPIVFDPRVGAEILSTFAQAINGLSVARKTSFLHDALGTMVFHPSITIMDDPFMPRGRRSRAFDAEGLLPQRRAIVEQGRLTSWILDLSSGRQLGMPSTGNATRGPSSVPRPSVANFYMQPGVATPSDLISGIQQGFFVTELMGNGINGITGDLSLGASGLWIEKGCITHAVSEVTIAGNLKDIFKNIIPANDLLFRFGLDVPTFMVDGMTIAGA